MKCQITFKVNGEEFTYDTNLSADQITLENVVNEIVTKNISYQTKRSAKKVEGNLPSALADYFTKNKNSDRNIRKEIIKAIQEGKNLVGNCTLNQLSQKYPFCKFNDLELNNDEDILFVSKFEYEGIGFGGKIKIGDKSFFIIKNGYDAQVLVKYLNTRKKLLETEINFNNISDSIRDALNFVKQVEKVTKDQTALTKFFDNPDKYLYKITDSGVDVHTTLSNYIKENLQESYVEEYEDQFINTVINSSSSKDKNFYQYISNEKLNKIIKEFNLEINDDTQLHIFLSAYFKKKGYPIKAYSTKTNSVGFKFEYYTFGDIGLANINTTELAVLKDSQFGYKIYKYGNKYYVSSNTIITKDTYAKQFDSLEFAEKYLKNKIEHSSIINNFNRDKIGISGINGENFEINTSFREFSTNTVFTAISNYQIPVNEKLEFSVNKLNDLLHGSIKELIDYFNQNYNIDLTDIINSYEKAVIFLYELSKLNNINNDNYQNIIKSNINDVKDKIDKLSTKDFLIVQKLKNSYILREVSNNEDSWKNDEGLATPIIVPLTNFANLINDQYKQANNSNKNLVEIITTSDFDELPKEINKEAKGFIYNGTIYINASRASLNDLPHELGHLMLGMIKATNINTYMDLINRLSTMNEIQSMKELKRNQEEYKYLAEEDLIEEVFVDLVGQYIVKNNKNLGLIGNQINKLVSDAVEDFGSSLVGLNTFRHFIDNFSSKMKDFIFSGNGLELNEAMGLRRRAANLIADGIKNKEIEMICEP